MGDPWHDEGFGGENDWGAESIEADLEEDLLEPIELDEDEPWEGELEDDEAE
jgi:hypothetical protein